MKIFKNVVTIAALCAIGSVDTKQTGARPAQQTIPQPIRPVIQQPTQKIPTTTPTTTQPSQRIPQESPKTPSFDTQYFVKKINNLDVIATETYKMIEEHFANMQLEDQITILDATKIMFHNLGNQIEKVADMYKEHKKLSNQTYMVTEKNKEMMQNNLTIETNIRLGMFINKITQNNFSLNDQDMQQICENIDFILRKANADYIQLGSTNEEQIANAKMAMDIAENIIIDTLSRLKTSDLRKLSDYILNSKYANDKRIENIRKGLPTRY